MTEVSLRIARALQRVTAVALKPASRSAAALVMSSEAGLVSARVSEVCCKKREIVHKKVCQLLVGVVLFNVSFFFLVINTTVKSCHAVEIIYDDKNYMIWRL